MSAEIRQLSGQPWQTARGAGILQGICTIILKKPGPNVQSQIQGEKF